MRRTRISGWVIPFARREPSGVTKISVGMALLAAGWLVLALRLEGRPFLRLLRRKTRLP